MAESNQSGAGAADEGGGAAGGESFGGPTAQSGAGLAGGQKFSGPAAKSKVLFSKQFLKAPGKAPPQKLNTGAGFKSTQATGRAFKATEPPLILPSSRAEPLLTYQFQVIVGEGQGEWLAYATEVGGLDIERDVIEHKYIGPNFEALTQQIPGRVKWQPVTIKRLFTANLGLLEWFLDSEGPSVVTGQYTAKKYPAARKKVSITAFHRNHKAAVRWDLLNAWPSKLTGPQFDSSGGDFGFEEVTLVYDSITRTVLATGATDTTAAQAG